MSELDSLLKEIDKYKVVSFDIFDTLLLRDVLKPADIFRILEVKVKEKYNIEGFAQTRMDAEADSRKSENDGETSLNLIYDEIKDISKKIKEEIKVLELDLERKFLIANPFMKKVFDYCLKNKKEIICITDMYLPKEFLENVLKDNGYGDVLVYLSCDYMKQKRDGALFVKVFEDKKYDKKSWLHIGDNIESDYNQPKANGIAAYHYKKVLDRVENIDYDSNIENSILTAIVNNQFNNGFDYSIVDIKNFNNYVKKNIAFAFNVFNMMNDEEIIYLVDSKRLNFMKKIMQNLLKRKRKKLKIIKKEQLESIKEKAVVIGEDLSFKKDNIRIFNIELDEIEFNQQEELVIDNFAQKYLEYFNDYKYCEEVKIKKSLLQKIKSIFK